MLFGYVLSGDYTTASHSGPFNLLSANYLAMVDGEPSPKTLFKQTGAVTSATLQLNFSFGGNPQFDWALSYPYLLLGVVNIGNYANEDDGTPGQITPLVKFTVNGRWNGGGAKTVQAVANDSGYSNAWAVIRKNEIVGATTTSTLQVELTGIFNSGVQAAFGNFGIGEIIICGADYLPLRNISAGIGGIGPNNRSSGNRGWPVGRSTFRTLRGTIAPMSQNSTFNVAGTNARTNRRAALASARRGSCVIAPLWRDRGTAGPNLTLLNQHAMMARLVSPLPDFSANADENMFGAQYTFEELL